MVAARRLNNGAIFFTDTSVGIRCVICPPAFRYLSSEFSMRIRPLLESDLDAISAVCVDSFMATVAPGLSVQGVATFLSVASAEAFGARMKEDNAILVAEEEDCPVGVIELKEGRHVTMFFVAPAYQRKGIGKALLVAVLPRRRGDVLTVRASLSSVPAYVSYGFACSGEVGEVAGLVYQPMTLLLGRAGKEGTALL